ncbi:MAG: helix-turn-helix transcriptional regulator [Ruminococcaceae bacterium]|nr:helix-turn-helix transcriptional regulator [Oscillospiraceae bacterium]
MDSLIKLEQILIVTRFKPNHRHWIGQSGGAHILTYEFDGLYEHRYQDVGYEVKENTILLINADDRYEVTVKEPGDCIAVHFTTVEPPDFHFTCLSFPNIQSLRPDFIRLFSAYNRRDESSWYACASILYGIFDKLSRFTGEKSPYVSRARYDDVSAARDYISENFCDPLLHMNQAAAVAGMSPRRFSELFRSFYHISPRQYVTQLRIETAKNMLRDGQFTLTEIAETVGYTSDSYLCRVFSEIVGISPAKWAEQK